MSIELLLSKIKEHSDEYVFDEVVALIEENYIYTPTRFRNGIGEDLLVNEPGSNEGSCKVFAFARLNQLTEQNTLACFAEHYRHVLANPQGTTHANIRRFMRDGWPGIVFEKPPLQRK